MNSSSRPYLTTLTPLRGIAALLVVIFHSNLMLMPFLPWGKPNFITSGWLWVDFFFVLSGFIISYVYGDSFKGSINLISYWKYIKARFARVYPLHFFTMVWCLICATIIVHYANGLHPFFADMLNPYAAVPSLFLSQSLGLYSAAPLNTPSWSLSTEWWMYLAFPFLMPYFHRIKMVGQIFTAIGITGLFLFVKYVLGPAAQPFPGGPPTLNVVADFGIFRCMAGFLLGMLLFRFYEKSVGFNFFRQTWVFVAFFLGVIVAMHFGMEDIGIVVFFPFIILAAAYNDTSIKKILNLRFLQRLGDWSFSIYMVHVPIIYVFWIYQIKNNPSLYAKFPPEPSAPPDYTMGLIACIILVAITLLLASITYRLIEVPSRSYLNEKFKPKQLEIVKVSS